MEDVDLVPKYSMNVKIDSIQYNFNEYVVVVFFDARPIANDRDSLIR